MPKRNKGGKTQQLGDMNKRKKKTMMKSNQGSFKHNSTASSNPYRPDPAGGKVGSRFRTRATINRLNMYNVKPDAAKMHERPTDPTAGRVAPDRKWFGNVRTVDQKELDKYRRTLEEGQVKKGSGFSVLLQGKKLPLSLVKDTYNKTLSQGDRLLQIESFKDTFGPKQKRKRPNIAITDLEAMVRNVAEKVDSYNPVQDVDLHKNDEKDMRDGHRHKIFDKGLSRRIWEELYKVIDSSDVILNILDARNPNGTRTKQLEDYLKKNCPHKHLIFILNKCDLVPTSCTQKWVSYLQKIAPTLAFQASVTNPFGKGSLIQLLKQFDILHKDKKNISVGFVGYPNVGKSSVINALKRKAVCKVAPIPGETKVWQYISLTKRIYLIDCPGIVYDQGESETDKVLKAVVRAERIPDPEIYIDPILKKAQHKHIYDVYGIREWIDSEDFINQVAVRTGKLLKGGEPDINNVSKSIIMDWQRGNIPYFEYPPREVDGVELPHEKADIAEKAAAEKPEEPEEEEKVNASEDDEEDI
jgi:nuclear GTP-binding protein